jgi:erythromycin esterase
VARTTLADELDERLATVPGVTQDDRDRFHGVIDRLLFHEWGKRPEQTDRSAFFDLLDRLEAVLGDRDSAMAEPFWEQEVRNVRNAARFAWYGASRDRAMGENLAWLASHVYPGRKLILWAHNNHLIVDKWMYYATDDTLATRWTKAMTLDQIARQTYLGHEARQYFGPNVFSLALLSHTGRYSPDVRTEDLDQRGNFDSLAVLKPGPAGSVEASLGAQGFEVAFVDLRRSPRRVLQTRALDYSQIPPMRMRYHEGYHGFLFLRNTFGLNEEPPEGWQGQPRVRR